MSKKIVRPIVGIDLGTTNSAAAYIHNGQPEIIPLSDGKRLMPSVAMMDMQGRIIVGETARASLVAMPDRVVAAVKRRMGSTELITMAGQQFSAQEISAIILKELKKHIEAKLGGDEIEAVITVPAYFTDEQRRATKQAGELAGFAVERIINEPTAAALAYGLNKLGEDRHILVYDLGGGTFDVSVVEMISGILEVRASAGDSQLGGEDFDWRLVDWLAEKVKKSHGIDPRQDIRAKSLLKEQAEKIKMKLSTADKVSVEIPLLTMKRNRPVGLFTEITREDFNQLIKDLLDKTTDCVKRALADAGILPADVQDILLVGGSTRIPRVREMIVELFKKEPRADVNPDEAVALGAAVQAGIKGGALSASGLIVTDVAPFSLGVAVARNYNGVMRSGIFHVIIPRNTPVPAARTDKFCTAVPEQTEAEIEIYQGEHEQVKRNHLLGKFLLQGIRSNRREPERIDVTYRYDLNGILEVTAKCVSNNKEQSLTVHDELARDSQEAFQDSMEKLNILYSHTEDGAEEYLPAEDPDGDDDWPEDEIGPEKFDALRRQAVLLRTRIQNIETVCNDLQQEKLKQIDQKLSETLLLAEENAYPLLQEAVDEAADFLIELETWEE
ncbi:MAG TPA: Hsp70 family protein [Methylomusa anaerophila]|uniref:Chaperone protein DnaK n=1 Tax=Methylomusa anaerophila TaxID=1930071 RepID=A0A348ANH1_9FIRM|nr:Hsp70 family protein [Methylomusa anaerophila]BBB92619.1 chaperone protein DnaK [Methylomusa anaerophila]HML87527.1 Hsp70 family protein [Methylomusa anaerophila]